MSFADLTLICAAGLLGPLLASPQRLRIPMLIGELAAGIVLGNTGTGTLDPSDPTFTFMANVGFALVMFVAGSHVPVRDVRLRTSIARGSQRAAIVAAVAVALGIGLSHAFGIGHAPTYIVLIASSSAALILPLVDSVKLGDSTDVLDLLAQVAIADTACIIALPLAIEPSRAGTAAVGALAVMAAAAVAFVGIRAADRSGARRRLHDLSEDRKFALELRISLLVLFGLAALAHAAKVSIMLAGFSLGLAIAAVGEPRRLARQLFGITEGFFGPLFFVWIGASLDLRALSSHPKFILLGVALGASAVVAHVVTRAAHQPVALSVLACAQLGVPIAAIALGTQRGVLVPGEPSALILGALITITASTLAARLAAPQASDNAASGKLSR